MMVTNTHANQKMAAVGEVIEKGCGRCCLLSSGRSFGDMGLVHRADTHLGKPHRPSAALETCFLPAMPNLRPTEAAQ